MSKARELANLLEADGDVVSGSLDNVPASDWNTLLNVPAHANTDTRDASNISTGTLPNARIVNLPNAQVAGLAASATTDTTDGSNIATGTLNIARLPEAAKNSNVDLTNLSADHLTSGTVATARLGTGTGGSGNYLRGDGTWTTNCTNHTNCTNCSGTSSHTNCTNCSGTSSHTNCTNCSGTGNGTMTGLTWTAAQQCYGTWYSSNHQFGQCNCGGQCLHTTGTYSAPTMSVTASGSRQQCACACNCNC